MQLFSYLEKQAAVIDRNGGDIHELAEVTCQKSDDLRQNLRVTSSY